MKSSRSVCHCGTTLQGYASITVNFHASAAFACVLQPGPAPVAEMATVPMQLAALHKAAQRGDEQEVAALLDQVMHKPGPSWACRAQHL